MWTIEKMFSKCVQVDSCMVWQGAKSQKGYGRLVIGGKNVRAHRLAYGIAKGSIPRGAFVIHNCDNPLCINPEHLRTGTNVENMADMVARDRAAKGNAHGQAKLTEREVLDARRGWENGEPIRVLARKHRVDRNTMRAALRGKTWSHL